MKKFPVMVFVCAALTVAGIAGAATPKRVPKINQNRIGPYAVGAIGQTTYSSDQSVTESVMLNILQLGHPSQNLAVETDDTDIGYQAQFGFRFHKYLAAELGLLKLGDLTTVASGDVDYPDRVGGFEPSTSEATFKSNGVLMSVLGVLPIGTKVEVFGRVGYMFTSVERDFVSKASGERVLFGGIREDTQETVYGLGLGFNLNQIYALHLEYQLIEDLGTGAVGSEDVNFISLGLQVRF